MSFLAAAPSPFGTGPRLFLRRRVGDERLGRLYPSFDRRGSYDHAMRLRAWAPGDRVVIPDEAGDLPILGIVVAVGGSVYPDPAPWVLVLWAGRRG